MSMQWWYKKEIRVTVPDWQKLKGIIRLSAGNELEQ